MAFSPGARAVSTWLLVGFSLLGCKSEEPGPGGGLRVTVQTELAVPKDVDHLRFEARQFGRLLQESEAEIGADALLLPAVFDVAGTGNSDPVLLRAVASKDGVPRIQRDAVTPIPSAYVGSVSLTLSFLCDGTAESDGSSTCQLDSDTCILGSCEDAAVTPETRPEPEDSRCFDVFPCFSTSTVAELDPESCSIAAPDGARGELLNVALRMPAGSAGICSDTACFAVIDRGDEGWSLDGERIALPEGVCHPASGASPGVIAVSALCESKRQSRTVCGDWSKAAEATPPIVSGVVGEPCEGPTTRACGRCGTESRQCTNGTWSSWSGCTGEGECDPDSSEACGSDGTRECGGDCRWGTCEEQRCMGSETRACGNCGTARRTCANGTWSSWSECSGERDCAPNSREACDAGGERVCVGSCTWGECVDSNCGAAALSEACGQCGTRTRTCDDGVLSEWSECDQGECAPGTSEECGMEGKRSCGGDCRWSECTGQVCGALSRSCGMCGTSRRSCENGLASEWSACLSQGECRPETVEACGNEGQRSCGGDCQWTACLGQLCEGEPTRSCGQRCGTESRTCNNGDWSDWSGVCEEREEACVPETAEGCGNGGVRVCGADCQWGACQECEGASSMDCGNCGSQTRTCTLGVWSEWSSCQSQGECAPNVVASCGNGGTQTCSNSCTYSSCVVPDRETADWPATGPSYTVLADTVIDNTTQLEWQLSAGTATTHAAALTACADLSLNGGGRWRLPTTNELASIVDYGRVSPSTDVGVFSDVGASEEFWTYTRQGAGNSQYVWFGVGSDWWQSNGDSARYRCVRDAPNRTLVSGFSFPSTGVGVDAATGLTWQLGLSEETRTYAQAVTYCNTLDLAPYSSGWRLPTIRELISIRYPYTSNEAKNSAFAAIPATEAAWSTTGYAFSPQTQTWIVRAAGNAETSGLGNPYRARCVHDAPFIPDPT